MLVADDNRREMVILNGLGMTIALLLHLSGTVHCVQLMCCCSLHKPEAYGTDSHYYRIDAFKVLSIMLENYPEPFIMTSNL